MGRAPGMATVAVLAAVERKIRYGLDISNATRLLTGTVYTTLRRLEQRGWVVGRWEEASVAEAERRPRRRYYTLTPDGKRALRDARHRLGDLAFDVGLEIRAAGEAD